VDRIGADHDPTVGLDNEAGDTVVEVALRAQIGGEMPPLPKPASSWPFAVSRSTSRLPPRALWVSKAAFPPTTILPSGATAMLLALLLSGEGSVMIEPWLPKRRSMTPLAR